MANALSNAPTTSIFAGIYAILYALLSMRVALHRLFINTRAGKDAFLDRTPEEQAAVSEEQVRRVSATCAFHGAGDSRLATHLPGARARRPQISTRGSAFTAISKSTFLSVSSCHCCSSSTTRRAPQSTCPTWHW
jgi:hypothetical protein